MKISFLLKSVAAIALLAAFGAPRASAVTIKGEAVVVALKGSAEFSANGRDWTKLSKDAVIKPGTEIRTAKDTVVDLFMNYNGPGLRIESDAQVVLAKLDREDRGLDIVTDTLIKVKSGAIIGYAQKASTGSRYVVETPKQIVNITGTSYTVNVSGFVVCLTGSIEVRYAPTGTTFGQVLTVPAGFTFDPSTGLVRPTIPADSNNLLASVDTLTGNIRRFSLARNAKVEVKTVSN